MLTVLGGKKQMDRATRQYLAQIKSDARNTITVSVFLVPCREPCRAKVGESAAVHTAPGFVVYCAPRDEATVYGLMRPAEMTFGSIVLHQTDESSGAKLSVGASLQVATTIYV